MDRRADEVAISEAETEIGYYQGEGLLLEDVCGSRSCWQRQCGPCAAKIARVCVRSAERNLNVEQCHCERHLSDPRWEALSEIKKKLQS